MSWFAIATASVTGIINDKTSLLIAEGKFSKIQVNSVSYRKELDKNEHLAAVVKLTRITDRLQHFVKQQVVSC